MLSNRVRNLTMAGLLLVTFAAQPQEDTAARTQAAKEAVMAFAKELSGALKTELEQSGPPGAIGVCSEMAPKIANRLSLQNGWKVGRVGTRVRNAMTGTPDAWEQQVLADFAARAAQGEEYQAMAHAEMVEEPGGRYFRFMKPIPVQEACLACHGSNDDIKEPVQAKLVELYPNDQAVGYQVGDLRGAFSIKQSLDIPLKK